MEWVETRGKSIEAAKEEALDRLGIGPDDAEFEILEEPRTGLFGRVRGEARVRARVKPATVRPKQERRTRRRNEGRDRPRSGSNDTTGASASDHADDATSEDATTSSNDDRQPSSGGRRQRSRGNGRRAGAATAGPTEITDPTTRGNAMSGDDTSDETTNREHGDGAPVAEVQQAAEEFTTGLLAAFGVSGAATSQVDGNEIEVRIDGQGDGLGLLIGPGGRTLLAIQDLARVAAQRRLGDHDTRLRIDVAGYREKRRVALERFAEHVAGLVKESGTARSLDPMPSADRKVIHDTLSGIDGVTTRSEGEDPYRRIIVAPA